MKFKLNNIERVQIHEHYYKNQMAGRFCGKFLQCRCSANS